MHRNWPANWGFIGDLRQCVGKTIERAELLPMEYGCVSDTCFLLRFTDGSRAYILGRPTNGLAVGPREMQASMIVTPEEYGEVKAAEMREKQERALKERRDKEEQLKRLQEELARG